MSTTRIRAYKVGPPGFNPIVFTDIDRALQEVKDLCKYGEVEDVVEIETVEMTQDEFDNLPEHGGF